MCEKDVYLKFNNLLSGFRYFYQMMECCHFLIKQNELKCKEKSGAVTLLTGNIEKLNSLLGPDSSPSGLAATFGK